MRKKVKVQKGGRVSSELHESFGRMREFLKSRIGQYNELVREGQKLEDFLDPKVFPIHDFTIYGGPLVLVKSNGLNGFFRGAFSARIKLDLNLIFFLSCEVRYSLDARETYLIKQLERIKNIHGRSLATDLTNPRELIYLVNEVEECVRNIESYYRFKEVI